MLRRSSSGSRRRLRESGRRKLDGQSLAGIKPLPQNGGCGVGPACLQGPSGTLGRWLRDIRSRESRILKAFLPSYQDSILVRYMQSSKSTRMFVCLAAMHADIHTMRASMHGAGWRDGWLDGWMSVKTEHQIII